MAEVEIGVLAAIALLEFWQFHRAAATYEPIRMPPRRSSTGINSPLEDFSLTRSRASFDYQDAAKSSKARHTRNTFPIGFSPERRGSISCEIMSEEDLCWTAPCIPKSEHEKELLLRILKRNVLMEHLESESLIAVMQALQKVQVPVGQAVITEGEFGDGSYIVEEGKLTCSMQKSGHKCDYGPVILYLERDFRRDIFDVWQCACCYYPGSDSLHALEARQRHFQENCAKLNAACACRFHSLH